MDIKVLSFIAAAGVSFCALPAVAEPFAFQGQLNDEGAPATGLYDLEFTLYGVDVNGTQIGPTVTLEDQQVSQGNFLVELDFGDVFDGSLRWIEVGVRNGDSVDPFTDLSPRVKVGNTPQASYATKAGVAETLTNPFWTDAPGILFFGEHEGSEQYFFNRDRDVDSTDVMVVHSAKNGLGGMTVSSWANGMPYYGFATNGVMRAQNYYDPGTDAWVVKKNGDQLEIDANNDVIITNNLIVGGTITSLSAPEPTTDFKSFTPDSIFNGLSNSLTFFNLSAGAIVPQNSGQYLRVDLNLPHGSTITLIEIVYMDKFINPNLVVELSTRSLSTMVFEQSLLGETSGSSPNVQTLQIQLGTPIVIDNTLETYDIRMSSSTGLWPAVGNLGVRSVLIEYTTP